MSARGDIDWDSARAVLDDMSQKELRKARKQTGRALKRARRVREALAEYFGNFMAGVTWATACRAALRESKRHAPTGGIRPASGECWTPREILKARGMHLARHEWDPLCAESWDQVKAEMLLEARLERYREEERAARGNRPGQVQFQVPLMEDNVTVIVPANPAAHARMYPRGTKPS